MCSKKELTKAFMLSFVLTTGGCVSSQPRPPVQGRVGELCPPPPPSVFEKAGIDIKVAQANVGKVLFGGIEI